MWIVIYYFFIEVVEGRYWTQALREKSYNIFGGNSVGILMRMMEIIFWEWYSGGA